MIEDAGGGASRSTDPAAGSSAATDVSLREYIAQTINALDRQITTELKALRRETQTARENARAAVQKAEQAQERRLDLLNEFRAQAADESRKYAQRDVVEPRIEKLEAALSRAYGGLFVVAFVGIANLIKVWFT